MSRKGRRLRLGGLRLQADVRCFISALIEKETMLYQSLEESIAREESAVNEGNMETLLLVLQEKQKVIAAQEKMMDEWDELARSLSVDCGRESDDFWDAVRSNVGSLEYGEIKRSVETMRSFAAGLLQKEKDVQNKLETVVSDLRQQMITMQHARKAVRGYSRSSGSIRP